MFVSRVTERILLLRRGASSQKTFDLMTSVFGWHEIQEEPRRQVGINYRSPAGGSKGRGGESRAEAQSRRSTARCTLDKLRCLWNEGRHMDELVKVSWCC